MCKILKHIAYYHTFWNYKSMSQNNKLGSQDRRASINLIQKICKEHKSGKNMQIQLFGLIKQG